MLRDIFQKPTASLQKIEKGSRKKNGLLIMHINYVLTFFRETLKAQKRVIEYALGSWRWLEPDLFFC